MFELHKRFLGNPALGADFSQGIGEKKKIKFFLSALCTVAEDSGPDSFAHSFFRYSPSD